MHIVDNRIGKTLLGVSMLLYLVALFIVASDSSFIYRWMALGIYVTSLVCVAASYFSQSVKKHHYEKAKKIDEVLFFVLILVLVEIISFIFLIQYPYISVHDEVRDAGLDALRVNTGQLLNFFTYGNYGGYGNIVPVIASFFHQIFDNSVLTYRLPAAIVSCLDAVVFYILLRRLAKKTTAVMGTIIYITLQLHIFYARTELIMALDMLLTSIMLLALCLWQGKRRLIDYVLLGTVLGFTATFHTAVRTVAVLILCIAVFIEANNYAAEKIRSFQKLAGKLLILFIFCLVGFGPMILNTNMKTFMHSQRYVYDQNAQIINFESSGNKIAMIGKNYANSLLVWVYNGTTSRYPAHAPIFPPLLAFFFVFGILYSLFVLKKPFLYSLVLLAAVIPFTNSAITDWVNADHRIMPLLPIGTIFVMFGIEWITNLIRQKTLKRTVIIGILIFVAYQTLQFFTTLPASRDKTIKDYLSMHVIYFLKSSENFSDLKNKSLCMVVSSSNHQNLNLMHYKEQYAYFLPETAIELKSEDIGDHEAYLYKDSCPPDYKTATRKSVTKCDGGNKFDCPSDYRGEIIIYY